MLQSNKGIKIKKSSFIFISAYLFIILIVILFSLNSDKKSLIDFLSCISVISLSIFILEYRSNFVSCSVFSIIFLYLYNCGQLWLLSIGYKFKFTNYLITQFSTESIFDAVYYFIIIINAIQVFLSLSKGRDDRIDNDNIYNLKGDSSNTSEDKALIITTQSLYFLCLIILSYVDVSQIAVARIYGYSSAYTVGRDNSVAYMFIFLYPFLVSMMMLISNVKLQKFAFYHGVIRSFIMMLLVGNRGQHIALLCMLYIFYYTKQNEKKHSLAKKHWLTIVVGLALVLVAGYVANIRNVIGGRTSFLDYLRDNNVFASILQELGGTVIDLILLINNCPAHIPWGKGISYVGGLLQYLPKMTSFFPELCKYNDLGAILNGYFAKGGGLGGSLIAELYFNFKWFAILVVPIYSFLLGKLDQIVKRRGVSVLSKGICFYYIYISFMYTRYNFSDIATYTRFLTYFLIIYGIIKSIIKRKNRSVKEF